MPNYDKKFSPAKASAPAAALYDFLANGPRSRDDLVSAIEAAVVLPDNEVEGSIVAMAKKRRAIATNAIYVARRSGRITEADGIVTLDSTIASEWLTYKNGAVAAAVTSNSTTPAEVITTLADDTIADQAYSISA